MHRQRMADRNESHGPSENCERQQVGWPALRPMVPRALSSCMEGLGRSGLQFVWDNYFTKVQVGDLPHPGFTWSPSPLPGSILGLCAFRSSGTSVEHEWEAKEEETKRVRVSLFVLSTPIFSRRSCLVGRPLGFSTEALFPRSCRLGSCDFSRASPLSFARAHDVSFCDAPSIRLPRRARR